MGGGNLIKHAAGWMEGGLTFSFEKFILDVDFCGALHAYARGVPVDDNQLAIDAFAEVGPGNHFFGSSHTLANYETAYWESDVADNDPWETWSERGSLDAATRANQRWKQVLADYEAPPIDPGTDEALRAFMERRKAEMPDAWH